MDEKISIIVPVYNVQSYLVECIESLIKQEYSNVEIILIDDGSTDCSGNICDEYAQKDNRITVIHQKNGGAANAKNTGLKYATGKYLAFVDSDDFVEHDAYVYMLAKLKKSDADIIQCSFRDIYQNRTKDQIMLQDEQVFDVVSYLNRYTFDWTCGLLWDKLYRRELFESIFFEEGHTVDDEFFTYQGVMNAKKIVHDPKIVYNYRKRKSSVTAKREYRENTVLDKLDYLVKRKNRVIDKFPVLKQNFNKHFLYMLLWLSTDAYASKRSIQITKKYLKEYFSENSIFSIEWRILIPLFRIRFASVKWLLKRKNSSEIVELTEYFE